MASIIKFLSTPKFEDPLANLELPLVNAYIKPLYNHDTLDRHIHGLVATVIFYQTLYVLSSVISPILFKESFAKINRKTQIDFSVHVVSFIQSILIIVLSIPAIIDSPIGHDRVFGYNPYNGFITVLALGYFIWDTYISAIYVNLFGVGFLIHGIVSASVYFIGLSPFISYYGPIFIFFEISTPFLNLRWFGIKFPELFSEKFKLVNNAVLILIFFLSRIVFGWYQAFNLFIDFYLAYDDPRFNVFHAGVIFFGNSVLNVLNLYWFYRMFKVAVAIISDLITGKNVNDELKKDI